MHSVLRPNYRRAREIRNEMEDLDAAIVAAEQAGDYNRVDDLKVALHDLQHELFLTGVASEYDL